MARPARHPLDNGYHVQQIQKISDYKVVALCDIVKEKTADLQETVFQRG